jgi:hypothetical protein
MSEIELALVKSVGVSQIFCLLDAPSSSHGRRSGGAAVAKASERLSVETKDNSIGEES